MKQLALVLSLLLLLSLTSGAFAVDQKQVQNAKHETLIPVAKDIQAKQGSSATILGEANIFEEDFEGDLSAWFLDGGYNSDGGTPAISVHPALWEVSQVKANSPTHSLFHPDEVDVSRSFAFSPAFVIPAEIGGDPVVSAKVSFQGNIDNPGYGDPTGATNNLADYFMTYAGIKDTQFSVVDVEGNQVYYSGYPEENSFQYLTSPTIDLTAAVAPIELDFKYLLINEENWDLARVDLLVDGVDKYVTVAQFDNTPEWADAAVDISAYAGKTLKVRFSFLPDDGTAVPDGGFWVDDITVKDANGDLFKDDAEAGNAVMNAFGLSLQRLFYDYDAGDAGAAWHLWDESYIFNGTTDLFDLGLAGGDTVFLAFRYIADGDNTQGEDASAGFFIDDIAVAAISGVPADAAISDLVIGYPRTPGFATPVAATVSNFGFEAQEIALWYKIDDGAAKPVPPRLSLPAFYDSTRIFNANLPAADSTLFTAYTVLTDDAVPENDAMSAMVYPDAPGTATFSNFNGTYATYTTSNRIVMFDPLAALAGVEKYDVKSVDIYMYGTADDVVNVKVATWTDDPTVPGEILAEQNLNVPVGITPLTIDVNKTGLTQKLAVWFDFTTSAKKAGPLLDTITPFKGNEIYLFTDGNWYYSGRGTMAFVNAAYALPPTMLTTFEENFDAPVDLGFWTPNTSTLDDGTPVFAVTQEEDALKVVMNQKAFPDGQMYDWVYFNEYFDLTAAPMWSMKIKVMPGATYTKDGKATALTEIPFSGSPFTILKDQAGADSLVRQHSNPTVKVPVDGEWHDVMFDWSTADTDPQYPNDFTNITRLLLETVTWPGTHQATFYIDDVKVGDAAVPPVPPLPQVFHASHPPAIDGKLDPIWKHAQWVRDYVTPGGTPAFNNAALSWRAMWDNDYLYLFITVIDDIFLSDTPNTWQGDSVELWLDGDNSKAAAYDGVNDLGFGFKYLNDPANPLIFNNPGGEWYKGTTGHLYGASYVEGGVNLEVAVPMKNLTLTPAAGNLIGMDMDWNDNDLGGARANKVKWFDATDNSWQNPSLMGTIQLAERTIYDYTDVWYTDAAPVIDGTPDDMSGFPTFELNQYMTEVAKLSNWDKDAKLQYQAVWDEKAVYYQVHITDDVLVQDGVYDHTDDGLELWFDGDNSRKTVYDGINDIGARFGYVPGGGLDSLMVFGWGGSGHYIWGPGTIDFASSPTTDGVFLEFAISMDTLGMKPVNGYMFAHELDYNDDDDGEGRDTKCKTHSIVDDTWINPSYMSSAKLMGGPGEPLPAEPEMLQIDMTAVPPVIDGTLDRMWENSQNYQMGTLINGAIDDWWDSYGNFRVLYDAKNFYVFVEVHDDVINTEHGTDYERDSIELFLDGNNSKNPMGADPWAWPPTAYDADDTQLRFVFDTAPINSIGSYDVSTFEYAYLETETGWNFELLMPWAGQPFKGVDGLKIGLEVALNDNDGANREAITNWWSAGGEAWHDPSTFGTAQFTKRTINEKTAKQTWDRLLPIPFTAYPVKVDGQADYGWDSVAPVFSNMRMNADGNKMKLGSPLDGQIEWKAMWDYNNLYLLIDVTDDAYVNDSVDGYNDDGVEIWFDGDASMLPAYTDANDLSFGMTYNADTILDAITTWRGNPPLTAEQMALIGQAQVLTDHGFTVELSLPMSILGVEAADGSLVAIEVDYNDDDDGDVRDTKLKSYDPTDNSWQYPNLLGMARLVGSVVKSDVEENVEIVVDYELNQNYPNPFNPTTTIEFALPLSGKVKLAVYDILGREVMTLVDTKMEAGRHSATFDASRLSSGVYFYRLQTSERVFTKKMMLIK